MAMRKTEERVTDLQAEYSHANQKASKLYDHSKSMLLRGTSGERGSRARSFAPMDAPIAA